MSSDPQGTQQRALSVQPGRATYSGGVDAQQGDSQSQQQSPQQSLKQPKKESEKRRPAVLGPLPLDPIPPDNISLRPGSQFSSRRAVQEAINKRAWAYGFPIVCIGQSELLKNGLANDRNFNARLTLGCFCAKNVPQGGEKCPWRAKIKICIKEDGDNIWEIEEVVNEHNHGRFKDLGQWKPPEIKVPIPLARQRGGGDQARNSRRPVLAAASEKDAMSESEGDEYKPSQKPSPAKRAASSSSLRSHSSSPSVDPDYQFFHHFSASSNTFPTYEAFCAAKDAFAASEGLTLWDGGFPKTTTFSCVTKSGRGGKRDAGACEWKVKVKKGEDGLWRVDEAGSEFVHTGHDVKPSRREREGATPAANGEATPAVAGPSQAQAAASTSHQTPAAASSVSWSGAKRATHAGRRSGPTTGSNGSQSNNDGGGGGGVNKDKPSSTANGVSGTSGANGDEKKAAKAGECGNGGDGGKSSANGKGKGKEREMDLDEPEVLDLTNTPDDEDVKPEITDESGHDRRIKHEENDKKPSLPAIGTSPLASARTIEKYLEALEPERPLGALTVTRFSEAIRAQGFELEDLQQLPNENAPKFVELLMDKIERSPHGVTPKDALVADIFLKKLQARKEGRRS